jgi:hypothetical protein
MVFLSSCKFESAARATGPDSEKASTDASRTAPPLVSGRFVECHGIRTSDNVGVEESTSRVADAIEEAWLSVRTDDGDMVPLLLSPLHMLRLFFSTEAEHGDVLRPAVADALVALSERLVAEQVASAAQTAMPSGKEGVAAADGAWPYDATMPTLLLVDAACSAHEETTPSGVVRLVCNPQTPVRDWFRVLNSELVKRGADSRILPLLTVEGTPESEPVYAAVRIPAMADYYTKHQELRKWGVEHQKDPGVQWQVCCDYTKIAMRHMQEQGVAFSVQELVMSHDRALRGVLVHNYNAADMRAMREKFGVRMLDDS